HLGPGASRLARPPSPVLGLPPTPPQHRDGHCPQQEGEPRRRSRLPCRAATAAVFVDHQRRVDGRIAARGTGAAYARGGGAASTHAGARAALAHPADTHAADTHAAGATSTTGAALVTGVADAVVVRVGLI